MLVVRMTSRSAPIVRGTPWFLAPEQWKSVFREIDIVDSNTRQAQIWSLGITCNNIMKLSEPRWFIPLQYSEPGKPATAEDVTNWYSGIRRQLLYEVRRPMHQRSKWWHNMDPIIARMLEEDPAKRITEAELCQAYGIPVPERFAQKKDPEANKGSTDTKQTT